MKHSLDIVWDSKMHFTSKIGDHVISMDSSAEYGGENHGPGPKFLLLVSLGGCTGMDVIAILKKMGVEPLSFHVRTEGLAADEHPKKYNEIKLTYEFEGENLDRAKIEKAVALSFDKYCGVKATLENSVKMSYGIIIR